MLSFESCVFNRDVFCDYSLVFVKFILTVLVVNLLINVIILAFISVIVIMCLLNCLVILSSI